MADLIFANERLEFIPYVNGLHLWQTWGTDNLVPFELAAGETYTVSWDGMEYPCVAVTNGELFGVGNLFYGELGEDTGEPFVIGINADGSNTFILTPESGTHSIEIYRGVPGEGIVLKDRNGADLVFKGKEKVKIPTESGGKQIFSRGEAITNVPIELDFSGGDQMLVAAPEGQLVKSAIIYKPEGLVPENIAKDQVVAGIVGTHEGGGSQEPYVEYTLNDSGKIVGATLYGFTEVSDGMFAYCKDLEWVDVSHCVITRIGERAFDNCASLVSFDIPSTVTSFGNVAFQSCTSLSSVVIPEGITNISDNLFRNCTSLTSVTIPESVTSIGEYAFYLCGSLKNIELPSALVSIGTWAFYGSGLTSITFPDSVTSIGSRVCSGCASLTSITLGSGITELPTYTFMSCTALTNIAIPDSIISIGGGSFWGCTNLKTVAFGSGLSLINSSAFADCTSLMSVIVPDNVTRIDNSAFANCSTLASITIGSGVKRIGAYAFQDCTKLTYAKFTVTSGWWRSTSSTATSGTSVSATYVGNTSTMATYLRSTYYNYYWGRS